MMKAMFGTGAAALIVAHILKKSKPLPPLAEQNFRISIRFQAVNIP